MVKVLTSHWDEVVENCPNRNGSRCTLSGESCCLKKRVELTERREVKALKEDSFSIRETERLFEERTIRLSLPRGEDASRREDVRKLRVDDARKRNVVVRFERLPKRVNVPCTAITRKKALCKNSAAWALSQKCIETLVCGTHRQVFEALNEELDCIEDSGSYGFSLKRSEESVYAPTTSKRSENGRCSE